MSTITKKTKIKKNLTDEDMLANYMKNHKEEPSFEEIFDDTKSIYKKKPQEESFLTSELKEKINKALLELKVNLYSDGIVDYDIKVTCKGNQILLTAVSTPQKKNKKTR